MKRLLFLSLLAAFSIGAAACGDDGDDNKKDNTPQNEGGNTNPGDEGGDQNGDGSVDNQPCTTGSRKCNDKGTLEIICADSHWTVGDTCQYGCENGKCKDTPDVGSDGSYCEGQILHYTNANGEDKTEDCASYNNNPASPAIECQTLADGTSDCVYNHATVAGYCTTDREIIDFECEEYENFYFFNAMQCTKNAAGEYVAIETTSFSLCGVNQGSTGAAYCVSADEAKFATCSTCEDSERYTAVCDGTEILPSDSSSRYVSCDDYGCQDAESNESCSAICLEETGSADCYVDTQEGSYGCAEVPSESGVCNSAGTDCAAGRTENQAFDVSAISLCDANAIAECRTKYQNDAMSCIVISNDTYCMPSCTGSETDSTCSESDAVTIDYSCQSIGGTKVLVPTNLGVCDGVDDDTLYYCGEETLTLSDNRKITGNEYCAGKYPDGNYVSMCTSTKVGCYESCTSLSATRTLCETFDSGDIAYVDVCEEVDGRLIWQLLEDNTTIQNCTGGCNDSGTACK